LVSLARSHAFNMVLNFHLKRAPELTSTTPVIVDVNGKLTERFLDAINKISLTVALTKTETIR